MVSTLQQDEATLTPRREPAQPTPPAGRAPGTARPRHPAVSLVLCVRNGLLYEISEPSEINSTTTTFYS